MLKVLVMSIMIGLSSSLCATERESIKKTDVQKAYEDLLRQKSKEDSTSRARVNLSDFGSIQNLFQQMQKEFKMMDDDFFKDLNDRFQGHDMDSLFDKFGDVGLMKSLGSSVDHKWTESKSEKTLILKVGEQESSPLDIKIEKGQIKIKGTIKKEEVTENEYGKSTSISVQSINKNFSIPSDCNEEEVEIKKVDSELHIIFKKKA